MKSLRNLVFVGMVSLALVACGGSKKEAEEGGGGGGGGGDTAQKSLYERLGGQAAIEKVIDDFLANVVADDRINARFANTDAAALRGHLVNQVCEATGGPCKYTGRSMLEAHAGMNITEDEWNALVEDLVKALDANGVPEAEKNELLGALSSMKGDIVGR